MKHSPDELFATVVKRKHMNRQNNDQKMASAYFYYDVTVRVVIRKVSAGKERVVRGQYYGIEVYKRLFRRVTEHVNRFMWS